MAKVSVFEEAILTYANRAILVSLRKHSIQSIEDKMAGKNSFNTVRPPNRDTAEATLEAANPLAKAKVVKLSAQ